jgi:hypothetical protein
MISAENTQGGIGEKSLVMAISNRRKNRDKELQCWTTKHDNFFRRLFFMIGNSQECVREQFESLKNTFQCELGRKKIIYCQVPPRE